VLIIKEQLSDRITSNDPEMVGKRVKPVRALHKVAARSAQLVHDFVGQVAQLAKDHPVNRRREQTGLPPANYLLVRGAGNRLEALPRFARLWRLRGAVCVTEPGVIKATCLLAGFDAVTVPELDFVANLNFVFDQIDSLLADYEFVYAHIKGPDEPAHDGDFDRKCKMIQQIDERLATFRDWKGILVVTTDHITSCELRAHARGPVPVLVWGRGTDEISTFDELSAKKGRDFGSGKNLMKYIFASQKVL
jgi:2,3-bisphosphoglycerate-independent phosphoglycerate mutase